MIEYNISLLREKFTLRKRNKPTLSAFSNRIELRLKQADDTITETYIIRTQNTWSCIRLAGEILSYYETHGPLSQRKPNWDIMWKQAALNAFDAKYNGALWGAVYKDGHPVFSKGNRHDFLDIIETCQTRNKDKYDGRISYVENALSKAGSPMKIDYDANFGMVVHLSHERGRFSILYRNRGKGKSFQISITRPNTLGYKEMINKKTVLNICAGYLEGIQLCYKIAQGNRMIRRKSKYFTSESKMKYDEVVRRLNQIKSDIRFCKETHQVRYRPEEPDFDLMISNAGG